jgi:hypothetical protein
MSTTSPAAIKAKSLVNAPLTNKPAIMSIAALFTGPSGYGAPAETVEAPKEDARQGRREKGR